MSRSKFFCFASLVAMLLLLGLGTLANAGSVSNQPGDNAPSIDIGDPQFGTGGGGHGCGDPDEFGIYSRPEAPGESDTSIRPADPLPARDPRGATDPAISFWLTLARALGVAGF